MLEDEINVLPPLGRVKKMKMRNKMRRNLIGFQG